MDMDEDAVDAAWAAREQEESLQREMDRIAALHQQSKAVSLRFYREFEEFRRQLCRF